MKKISLLFLLLLGAAALAISAGAVVSQGISAQEALRLLKEGHVRFLEGKSRHPHQDAARRALTAAQGQHPLAVILSCADSRVPPEIIFDQGIGDIFVVRVAGNIAAGSQLASIKYAVEYLGAPLVVVLGHSHCGAVAAALAGGKQTPNLADLLAFIQPAVEKARQANPGAAQDVLLNAAITDNVRQAMADFAASSPSIRERLKDGRVRLVGAVYELDSGQIHWLGPEEKPATGKKTGKKGD
jgi:carbonic anhydrase